MSNNSETQCESPFIGRLDPGWQKYHIAFNAFFLLVIITVSLTWIWLWVTKRKTDLGLSYMTSLAVAVVPYLFFKALFIVDEPNILTECTPHLFSTFWLVTKLLPIAGVHYMLENKIRYNQAMAKYFAEHRELVDKTLTKSSSTLLDTEYNPKTAHVIVSLQVLKKKCAKSQLARWYLTSFCLAAIFLSIICSLICHFDCQIFETYWSRPYLLGVIVHLIFLTGYVLMHIQMGQLVDGGNLLYTAGFVTYLSTIPGLMFNILNLLDEKMFMFFERDPVGFNWNIGIDWSMLSYYFILCMGPIFHDFSSRAPPKPELELREILNNPSLSRLFEEFLQVSFCVENILFLRAVETYKSKPALAHRTAPYIYFHFVRNEAEAQINLPYDLKNSVASRIRNRQFTPTLFDEAQKEIERLLNFDLLPRFVASPYYTTLIASGFPV